MFPTTTSPVCTPMPTAKSGSRRSGKRRDSHVFQGRTRQGIVRAYQATVPDLVEQVVQDGIRRGELKRRDARWLAWAYVAIVETTLTEYAQDKLGSLDDQLEAALGLFLEGAGMTHAH